MTLRTVFGPLLHALSGGRCPAPARTPAAEALPLGSEWGGLLAELGLPRRTFQDVAAGAEAGGFVVRVSG